MIPITHFIFISIALFSIGVIAVVTKKNAIVVLMGIELMLNAANINLVAFSQMDARLIQGQFFALFVMVIAAAEAAVALAIVLKVYNYYKTTSLDKINELKD